MALRNNLITRGSPVRNNYRVASGKEISIGDFLWYDPTNDTLNSIGGTDATKAAAALVRTWSSESRAIRDARARFAGIANFQHGTNDPVISKVSLETSCFCDVAVASATYKKGDLLGFAKDSGGNYLYANQLKRVTNPQDAVAVVAEAYTSATTIVSAFIIGARDTWNDLAQLVDRVVIALDGTCYATGAGATNILLDYTFNANVRIFNAKALVTTATTGANVFTLKNGSNSIDDTLTVPGSTAIGTVVTQAIEDANSYHDFLHDDLFDITTDGGASAGAATLEIEYYRKPVL